MLFDSASASSFAPTLSRPLASSTPSPVRTLRERSSLSQIDRKIVNSQRSRRVPGSNWSARVAEIGRAVAQGLIEGNVDVASLIDRRYAGLLP